MAYSLGEWSVSRIREAKLGIFCICQGSFTDLFMNMFKFHECVSTCRGFCRLPFLPQLSPTDSPHSLTHPFPPLTHPQFCLDQDGTMGEAFSFNIAGSSASSPGSEEPVFGPLTQAQSGRRHAVDQGDTSQNRCALVKWSNIVY